jgi:hypothetical protein
MSVRLICSTDHTLTCRDASGSSLAANRQNDGTAAGATSSDNALSMTSASAWSIRMSPLPPLALLLYTP